MHTMCLGPTPQGMVVAMCASCAHMGPLILSPVLWMRLLRRGTARTLARSVARKTLDLYTYPRGIPRPPLPARGLTLSLYEWCCTTSWTHNGNTSRTASPLVLGTALQEPVNSHVHECTHHMYHSLLLVEQMFQESPLEMALRERNGRQNPNGQGEHPRSQLILAVSSTPA